MKTPVMAEATTDRLEQILQSGEATIARIRAIQMEALLELDQRQVPLMDGSRNLSEWATARMDVAPETALRLVQTAHRLQDQPGLTGELKEGAVSFDRVVEESRLVSSGAGPDLVARSRGWDLTGLRRMVARHQRLSGPDETQMFGDRFLSLQPTLDQTSYKLWGQLPGTDGRLVEQALTARADQFPPLPDGRPCSRTQRHADALVSIAHDSLDGTEPTATSSVPMVSIFVDAHPAAQTNGQAGATIDTGPRIGPLTLEEILCDGHVEILTSDVDGTPLSVGPTSRTIPPKLKRFILHRDGGTCTADGCQSRYRLQPHHITPKSQGGSHDPANLTTLCWFHHHVVIHRNRFRIDPASPPQRRRFLKPEGRDPP